MLTIFLAIIATSAAQLETESTGNLTSRQSKSLSVFQVVRFPNIGCVGTSSLNGTCYTSSECTNKGGTSAGSCASGFGVCCTFTIGCGSTISENCTYFQSSSTNQPTGQCAATVCKCSSDICQLRLDFSTFVISGPSTSATTEVSILNGNVVPSGGGKQVTTATQCLTDTFSVTGNGQSPPVICGTNSGYHMYVDASPNCNTLAFQLGNTGVYTTLATRQWNIKVSQISCYSTYLPPPGCTQYFTGVTGYLNSYNYAATTPVELANQEQNMCIRRARGYCRICYSPTSSTDFQVSAAIGVGFGQNSQCCAYGTAGLGTKGFDCLVIPGAVKMTIATPLKSIPNNQFCGNTGFVSSTAANKLKTLTVCSYQTPFNLQFYTDAYTFASALKKGFKIAYFQTTC